MFLQSYKTFTYLMVLLSRLFEVQLGVLWRYRFRHSTLPSCRVAPRT